MSTVPKGGSGQLPQPPTTDKFNPQTGLGQVSLNPPKIGDSPPGSYQAEPTTGKGKGNPGGKGM
jgi:hypothetical protein